MRDDYRANCEDEKERSGAPLCMLICKCCDIKSYLSEKKILYRVAKLLSIYLFGKNERIEFNFCWPT